MMDALIVLANSRNARTCILGFIGHVENTCSRDFPP